ncbi:LysR family transcriptional regulator [Clostridium sp. AM58-1XD]|uniref:LysR family transcriptional regulator n=1 Tax=Clostridium sp. AM58-1XD TaxID=2292307 RepID=UPI0015F749D7|nr:LysR family transcriptional regulator [Clostridium sp. AM58-1XD]
MDFKQLFYIVKVAECQNITKAAKALFVSQPSLSQFISKAEEELGVKIFDRSTNPLTLTYAGRKYIEAARKILDINDNVKKELQDIAGYQKGLINLGIPKERGSYMLPGLMKEFKKGVSGD